MAKKGKQKRNLAGFIGEIDTQLEIWKTELMMGWNNEMTPALHHDIDLFQLNIGSVLVTLTALLDEETQVDEGDIPF